MGATRYYSAAGDIAGGADDAGDAEVTERARDDAGEAGLTDRAVVVTGNADGFGGATDAIAGGVADELGCAEPAGMAGTVTGFTFAPDRTFCSPSTITRSPGCSPEVTSQNPL